MPVTKAGSDTLFRVQRPLFPPCAPHTSSMHDKYEQLTSELVFEQGTRVRRNNIAGWQVRVMRTESCHMEGKHAAEVWAHEGLRSGRPNLRWGSAKLPKKAVGRIGWEHMTCIGPRSGGRAFQLRQIRASSPGHPRAPPSQSQSCADPVVATRPASLPPSPPHRHTRQYISRPAPTWPLRSAATQYRSSPSPLVSLTTFTTTLMSWDLPSAPSTPTTPTTPFDCMSRAQSQLCDAPYPTNVDHRKRKNSEHVTEMEWEARRHTIRRKKGSFDLRDIFRNGGLMPGPPARIL